MKERVIVHAIIIVNLDFIDFFWERLIHFIVFIKKDEKVFIILNSLLFYFNSIQYKSQYLNFSFNLIPNEYLNINKK